MAKQNQVTLPLRWVIGAGGFIGEVSLVAVPPEYPALNVSARCALLTDFYVHPLRRRRGWGEALLTAALQHADKHAIDLVLWAQPHGTRKHGRLNASQLVALYSSHGFNYFGKEGDMVRYAKT